MFKCIKFVLIFCILITIIACNRTVIKEDSEDIIQALKNNEDVTVYTKDNMVYELNEKYNYTFENETLYIRMPVDNSFSDGLGPKVVIEVPLTDVLSIKVTKDDRGLRVLVDIFAKIFVSELVKTEKSGF